jgi:tetratricopeptide (TPR) repeat protein
LPAGIALAVCVSFFPALENDFVNWDDEVNFTRNPHYRGLSPENLKWMVTDTAGHYMPVTWFTLGLDYVLWGMDARGYHATNLLFHMANAVLFYHLLLALLGGMARWAAAGGALFFALHPLRVESVAWITERRDVVSGVFFLLSILAYLRMQEGPRAKWYGISVACFALSLLSKAMGMALPLVLLALDLHPLRRTLSRKIFVEKIPYFLLMAGSILLTNLAQRDVGAMYEAAQFGWVDRLVQPGYRVCFYLWKLIVPLDLSPLYQFQRVKNAIDLKYILCGLAAIAITAALWLLRRRWPAGLAAWFCYGALLGPVIGLIQVGPHFAADRNTYLSLLPAAVLAGGLLVGARRPVAVGAALVLAVLGSLSFQQTKIWKDSNALWNHAVRVGPEQYLVHIFHGYTRMGEGDVDGALASYERALQLNPRFAEGYLSRGSAREKKGDLEGGLADCEKALALNPRLPKAYNNRAILRTSGGDHEGAIADCSRAIELDPRLPDPWTNRGVAKGRKGDLEGAIADCTQAIALDARTPDAYTNRAVAHARKGDFEAAMADCERAIKLDPRDPKGWLQRSAIRTARSDLEGAIADATHAIRLSPRSAEGYVKRGDARRAKKEVDGAIADYREAEKVDPRSFEAHASLGILCAGKGDLDGAIAGYTAALAIQPRLAATWNNRGLARMGKNDLAGAVADFTEALKIEPRFLDALTNRAGARSSQGDLAGAVGDCDEALRINPRSSEALGVRGGVRATKGEMEGAIIDFEEALRLASPGWPHRTVIEALLEKARTLRETLRPR